MGTSEEIEMTKRYDTTLVAGMFAQIAPKAGPSWHIVVAAKATKAVCGKDISRAEFWMTDQMRTFKVCEDCIAR